MSRLLTSALVAALSLAASTVGCASSPAPFTRPAGAYTPPRANEANLVFLWPESSCDPPGNLTIASSDGRYVATVGRGTQVWTHVPAGSRAFAAWNDALEQKTGTLLEDTVAALHGDLREGGTYYVLVTFGAWDEKGPRERWAQSRRAVVHVCNAGSRESTTLALVGVIPDSAEWADLPDWVDSLTPLVPTLAVGQAWLDAHHDSFTVHESLAEGRFARLSPRALRLATLVPEDGASK